ncbi:MAG: LemA family protein [Acidimicrobiia bacterium]
MTMRRTTLVLRVGAVVLLGVVSAGVGVAVESRSDLDEARHRVDRAWAGLHARLVERYDLLAAAAGAADERLPGPSSLPAAVEQAWRDWQGASTATGQVAAANRLEGLAARLAATVEAVPRLRSSGTVQAALDSLASSASESERLAYNGEVAAYERVRGGFPRALVAGVLGFDASRSLEVPLT